MESNFSKFNIQSASKIFWEKKCVEAKCFIILISTSFAGLQYWITLDAQRQISRSLFTESHERKMQKNITIKGSECTKHSFYMLASKSFKVFFSC